MRTLAKRKVEVTIRRPSGEIETIIHPRVTYMTDSLLAQMRQAMAVAGKGEVISYRNIDAIVEMEESDYQTRCTRCGERIDSRRSAHRPGYEGRVRVVDYYCDACSHLLRDIGLGDQSAWDEPKLASIEPEGKAD